MENMDTPNPLIHDVENPQTYYKNLAVFWNMFGHFSTLYMKA